MSNTTRSGLSFLDLLQISFIVLKLCNVIDWSWVWVLTPLWIPVVWMIIKYFVKKGSKEGE